MGLVSSIYLVNDTEPSVTTNTTGSGNGGSSDGSNSSASPSKVAPIVGGVVGGLAFIVIVAILAFIIRRQKKQQQMSELETQGHVVPVPFMTHQEGAVIAPYTATQSSDTASGTGSTPLSVPIRREKQGLHRRNLTAETSQLTGTSTSNLTQASHIQPAPSHPAFDATALYQSSGDPAPESRNGPRGEQLPTSELVRLLNERLQPRAWDEDESPPGYPSGE